MTHLGPRALVTGLNVVDVLVRTPEHISPGTKHEVQTLVVRGGAPAGNAACVMASLGLSTAYATWFGADAISLVAREELLRCGVRSDAFLNDPAARPGVAVVQITPDTGNRTVFYNLTGYRRVTATDFRDEWLSHAKLVLVDGYETEAGLPLLKMAAQRGLKRVLDLEAGDREVLNEMLELGTDAILPLECALWLSGEKDREHALRSLAARTSAQVIVTDGVQGSWAWRPEGILHQPAFRVPTVDTTGCGDAYHGAYAFALMSQWTLPVRMEFAAFVASRIALQMGGRDPHLTISHLRTLNDSQWSEPLRTALNTPLP